MIQRFLARSRGGWRYVSHHTLRHLSPRPHLSLSLSLSLSRAYTCSPLGSCALTHVDHGKGTEVWEPPYIFSTLTRLSLPFAESSGTPPQSAAFSLYSSSGAIPSPTVTPPPFKPLSLFFSLFFFLSLALSLRVYGFSSVCLSTSLCLSFFVFFLFCFFSFMPSSPTHQQRGRLADPNGSSAPPNVTTTTTTAPTNTSKSPQRDHPRPHPPPHQSATNPQPTPTTPVKTTATAVPATTAMSAEGGAGGGKFPKAEMFRALFEDHCDTQMPPENPALTLSKVLSTTIPSPSSLG